MADDKNLDPKKVKEVAEETKSAVSQIERYSKEAERVNQALVGIAGLMRKTASSSEDFGAELKGAGNLTKQVAKQAEELSKFTADDLKDKTATNKILKKQKLVKGQLQAIESKIAVLNEKAANATEKEADLIYQTLENLTSAAVEAETLLGSFEEIEDVNDKLNKDTSWLEGMADLADDIPVIGKLFGDFKKGAEEARKAGAEGGSALAAGGTAVAGAVGKMAAVFSGAVFLKAIYKTNQDITDLSRNLNLTTDQATALDRKFREVGIAVKGISGDDLRNATMAISNDLGVTADLSTKSGIAIAAMTKKLGLSAEQAASLARFSATSGQNIEDVQNNIIGTVQVQNLSNNTAIRYQDIMKDIAGASAATRMSVQNFPGGIAKAAYQARKLGLSFSQMEGIADSLLDYETSIANEMEAELLIGQDLELSGARQAALNNDLVGMTQELAKNGITAARFGDMNRIEQEAVAKAMGMSREEMAGMFEKQKAIEKLGGDPSKTIDEAVRNRYKEIQAMDEGAEKEAAMADLRATAGAEEITRQLENKSAAEAQKEAMQDMTAAVGELAFVLKPITAIFSRISELAGETFGFITKMGSKLKAVAAFGSDFARQFALAGRFIKNAKTTAGALLKSLGSGFKFAAKGGIKSVLKKIPILGALVGAGMAYQRFKKGDYLGGAFEVFSGIASIFPGIGTAVSVAADAALLGMDAKGITGTNSESAKTRRADPDSMVYTGAEANDFTLKTNPKDTITMAGGTKLGGNVEALLEELIGIVKGGGHVYLDGSKVGSTLVLNSKLSN